MATLVHLAEQIQAPNHTGLMTYETWRVLGVFNMVSSLLPIMTSKDISLTVQGCNMDRRWRRDDPHSPDSHNLPHVSSPPVRQLFLA